LTSAVTSRAVISAELLGDLPHPANFSLFLQLFQILVATEAAGEGINLQVCHILFNYDIPWNPNRLEQRMGRTHQWVRRQRPVVI
jgi:hypothetical protein